MKIKDRQNIVLSKYQKDDTPTELYRHLNGGISLATIKTWCQMIRQSATRDTCYSMDSQDTKENIHKKLLRQKQVSARRLSRKLLQQVSYEY